MERFILSIWLLAAFLLACQPIQVADVIDEDTQPPADPHEMVTATYQVDESTDFLNPERGFHGEDIDLLDGSDYDWIRTIRGYALSRSYVRLDEYRETLLPADFLDELRSGLERVREAGIKIALRFSYNFGDGEDAPLNWVLQHIEQLEPILADHYDVITTLQAGFIGLWGEWHGSTNDLASPENKRLITSALLDALPVERMVQLRSPYHRRHALDGPPPTSGVVPFVGSAETRVGFKNDCFVSTDSDAGTYNEDDQTQDREEVARFSSYTVVGGETCELGFNTERQSCSVALAELEQFHWDYLNAYYYEGVLDRWKSEGCYDEISRRLGYRLALERVSFPARVGAGEEFTVAIKLRNVGFGKVYNPRPVDLVLRSEGGGTTHTLRALGDARQSLPLAGETREFDLSVDLPADLPAGSYEVLLRLPDAASTLENDPRYHIRLANPDVWEDETGLNDLGLLTTVTEGAD